MSYQWENDTWQPTAGVPLSDRGFRHGMSAFATVRICRGKLVAIREHLEKLRHTCAQLGLRTPPDTLATFQPDLAEGIARLTITAGDGSFLAPLHQGRIFLSIEPTPPRQPPQSLAFPDFTHAPPFPGLKTGHYWPNIAAYRHASELQSDEIVLVNAHQHVISASLANLFAVIDDLLLTPRVSSGARAGVMRDWVIAREDVIVSDFHPGQLLEASEIFLTSSGYGIAPIATVDGKPLSTQSLGQTLRRDYLQGLETL